MNKKVVILFLVLFLQGVVTNIHHPLMPAYVRFLKLDPFMVGLFFSLMNIGTMLGGPFWGNKGDTGKKRSSVLIGLIIYAVGQFLFGLGHLFNPVYLSFFRLLSGFGIAAAITLIISELIVISPEESRSKNIAYGVAILTLGSSLGYFIGGQIYALEFFNNLFNSDKFSNMFLLQAILISLFAIFYYFIYKPEEVKVENSKRTYFWEGFKEIKNISLSLLFFLIGLSFITFAYTNIDKYLEIYFDGLGNGPDMLGNFKMIVGIVSIVTTFILVPALSKIKNRIRLFIVLQLISATVIFIVFNLNQDYFLTLIYTVYMIYIIIKAIFTPLEQDYISSFSEEGNTATLMGIRQSFFSIGTIIGPIVGAIIYGVNPILLFNISAVIFLIAIIFLVISRKLLLKEQSQN